MKTYKTCGVVMLPTNEKATDKPFSVGVTLCNNNQLRIGNPVGGTESRQHLYITSDEEIKEGDWLLTDNRDHVNRNGGKPKWELKQCTSVFNKWIGADNTEDVGYNPDWCKKVIATTDTSLISIKGQMKNGSYLPQIDQSFILHYMSEYNKGNKIEKIEVEIEPKPIYGNNGSMCPILFQTKINSDNTINIKPIKESWSRVEVEKVLEEYREFAWSKGIRQIDLKNWIIDNL